MMAQERTLPAASSMLTPKFVHENARLSAPESIDCPIDRLPEDIIHMICVYLRPTELAKLRLAYRQVGPISLKYMLPEVHLILAKDSFEQLKAIAAHPVASKYITSFFFEADRFSEQSREHWEHSVVHPEYLAQAMQLRMQPTTFYYGSDGTLWFSEPGSPVVGRIPPHNFAKVEMTGAYEKYVELVRFQQEMHPDVTEMAEAMKHFPRLNQLKLTIGDCGRSRTSSLREVFKPAVINCYEIDTRLETRLEPLGLQQMHSLLLGAYFAGLKVETLQCGLIDWRVFDQASETSARMRDSVSNVKNLRLDLYTGDDIDHGSPWWTPSRSYREGRVGDFIAAAPKLEHLQLSFHCDQDTWPRILGEYHWPCLKSINLKLIGTTEEELVSFCWRHASTLKSVHLNSVNVSEGDWLDAFKRMRKILTLDEFKLEGTLTSSKYYLYCQGHPNGVFDPCDRVLEEWFLRPCPDSERELAVFLQSNTP